MGRSTIEKNNDLRIVVDQTTQRITEKCIKTLIVATWILILIREVGDRFHKSFQIGL
jgi:hypothetical protein